MATSLTRNLKLRIDSNLTANSKYNLERLDLIGANFLATTSDNLLIRSRRDIVIEPESPDIDGSGSGGTVSIGSPDHQLDAVNIYADSVNLPVFSLSDQASGGDKNLRLKYKSDINGSVDTSADRSLFIDVDGADRNLVLGANFSLTGAALGLILTSALTLTLPDDYGTTGQILSTDGSGNLSWTSAGAGNGDVLGYSGAWITSDGSTKTVVHNLNSLHTDVTIIDEDDGLALWVDTIEVIDPNTLQLTASEAPANSWQVVVQAKP